jgi:hypothetical protein
VLREASVAGAKRSVPRDPRAGVHPPCLAPGGRGKAQRAPGFAVRRICVRAVGQGGRGKAQRAPGFACVHPTYLSDWGWPGQSAACPGIRMRPSDVSVRLGVAGAKRSVPWDPPPCLDPGGRGKAQRAPGFACVRPSSLDSGGRGKAQRAPGLPIARLTSLHQGGRGKAQRAPGCASARPPSLHQGGRKRSVPPRFATNKTRPAGGSFPATSGRINHETLSSSRSGHPESSGSVFESVAWATGKPHHLGRISKSTGRISWQTHPAQRASA